MEIKHNLRTELSKSFMNISSSAIDVIGGTPLVDLSRFAKRLGVVSWRNLNI
jgi:hypothetical protein